MPAEQSLGPDNERTPQASRHRPARRREQEPVETVETGALHLPLQHLYLVSKHQQLDVPFVRRATPSPERTANEEVEER